MEVEGVSFADDASSLADVSAALGSVDNVGATVAVCAAPALGDAVSDSAGKTATVAAGVVGDLSAVEDEDVGAGLSSTGAVDVAVTAFGDADTTVALAVLGDSVGKLAAAAAAY